MQPAYYPAPIAPVPVPIAPVAQPARGGGPIAPVAAPVQAPAQRNVAPGVVYFEFGSGRRFDASIESISFCADFAPIRSSCATSSTRSSYNDA